jgi:prophage regulatory protein
VNAVQPTPDPTTLPDPLLRDKEVAKMLGIGVATVWRRVRDKSIPAPIKLGFMARWPRSEILQAIELMKAKRGDLAA